jgi:cystathionine beta-lyase/cystathionine gamma-synthase
MTKGREKQRLRTLSVHGGEAPDPTTKAAVPNLVMSTTFIAEPDASFSVEGFEDGESFVYTRWGNPTVGQLEKKLSLLEGSESCIAFGSGMAAISTLLFHSLSAGDHLVISDVAYAATAEMTNDMIPRLGIRVTKVNMSDIDELRAALTPQTKLVFAETPCNPILRLTDIEAVAEITHRSGARLAVDSTFATPVATQPLLLGADYVIHSLTKYLCGHGDAIGGALLGRTSELDDVRKKTAIRTGGILSPFNAWLIMRGLATLPIRMEAHQQAAMQVASFLQGHPKVTKVVYPGLVSHPQYELAKRQMRNFSGMITFQVENGPGTARIFAERLKTIHYAVSLGHHRSLIFYLPTEDMLETSFRLTSDQQESYRKYAGDGIFRLSVGIEDGEDLCEDLNRALEAAD